MKRRWQRFVAYVKWVLRGRPMKTYKGGWCGCCGVWIEEAEFRLRDYFKFDQSILGDACTICNECIERAKEKCTHAETVETMWTRPTL